jgi:hypothetical protein
MLLAVRIVICVYLYMLATRLQLVTLNKMAGLPLSIKWSIGNSMHVAIIACEYG